MIDDLLGQLFQRRSSGGAGLGVQPAKNTAINQVEHETAERGQGACCEVEPQRTRANRGKEHQHGSHPGHKAEQQPAPPSRPAQVWLRPGGVDDRPCHTEGEVQPGKQVRRAGGKVDDAVVAERPEPQLERSRRGRSERPHRQVAAEQHDRHGHCRNEAGRDHRRSPGLRSRATDGKARWPWRGHPSFQHKCFPSGVACR